jgi:hypothetical protein
VAAHRLSLIAVDVFRPLIASKFADPCSRIVPCCRLNACMYLAARSGDRVRAPRHRCLSGRGPGRRARRRHRRHRNPQLVRASSEIGVSFPACRALRRRGGRRVCWGSRATVCGRLSWAGSPNDAVAAGDTAAAVSYREQTVDASEVFGPRDIRLTGYLRQGSCTLAERTRTHGLLAWRFRRRCWTRCSVRTGRRWSWWPRNPSPRSRRWPRHWGRPRWRAPPCRCSRTPRCTSPWPRPPGAPWWLRSPATRPPRRPCRRRRRRPGSD